MGGQTQPRSILLHRGAPKRRLDDDAKRRRRRPSRGRHAQPFELQPRLIRRRRMMRGEALHHTGTQRVERAGVISRSPTATAVADDSIDGGRLRARR